MKQDRSNRHWALFMHLRTAWRVLWHKRAPFSAKFLIVAAAVYAISPIDILPDFVLVAGWIDDAALVTLMVSLAFRLLPVDVLAECEGYTPAPPQEPVKPALP
jgi:uncharacterized membrane protein YkvA (DUF1232 family)